MNKKTQTFIAHNFSLFVFSMSGHKQNVNSILTHVSNTVFHALSHGSLHFALHGSLINRLFQRILLAADENQPIRKWLKKLPWKAKSRLPLVITKKTLFGNRCQK